MKFKILFLLLTLGLLPSISKGEAANLFDDYDSIAKRIVKIKTTIPIEYNQYVQQHINEFLKNDNSQTNILIGKGLYLLPEIEKLDFDEKKGKDFVQLEAFEKHLLTSKILRNKFI